VTTTRRRRDHPSRVSHAKSVSRRSLHVLLLLLLSVLLPINHLGVGLLVGLIDSIATDQRPSLLLQFVVLLNLCTTRPAPRRAAIEASAATDSKLLADPITLHPEGEARKEKGECAAHDHAGRVAPAEVGIFRAVWEVCEAMVGPAKHAWSTPDDGAACSRIVARADVVFPRSGWGRRGHDARL